MRIYTVHTHPEKPAEDVVFVKEGFSWPGFLVPVIWLAFRRLWLPLIVYFLATMALTTSYYLGGLNEIVATAASFLMQLYVGLEGNNLRAAALQKRGIHLTGIVAAGNLREAEIRYFTDGEAQEAAAIPEFQAEAI